MTDIRKETFGDVGDLVIRLMEQNARDAAFTTNALMDGYRRDALVAQATIRAIRYRVVRLVGGDYMPTPAAILQALDPSDEEIARFMPRGEGIS